MKHNFKPGKAYAVKFLDHCVGIKGSMTIIAIGFCVENTEKHAVFTSWEIESDDEKLKDDNREYFTIIKSCIIKKKLLRGEL